MRVGLRDVFWSFCLGFFFNYCLSDYWSGFGFRELLIFDLSYFWMLVSCVNFDILIWQYFVLILIFCLTSVCLLFVLSFFCFLCLFSSFCLFFSIRLLFFSILFLFVVMMLIINWFWEMSDFCLFYCLLLFFLVLGISYFFFWGVFMVWRITVIWGGFVYLGLDFLGFDVFRCVSFVFRCILVAGLV